VVVDAVSNDDLTVIAAACQDMVLMTGGSAVAMPLPSIWLSQGILSRRDGAAMPRIDGPAILLSGSCSAMTRRQVAAALAAGSPAFRLDPLELAERGPAAALDWIMAQDMDATPLIYATADPSVVRDAQARLGTERAGRLVEDALAACAVLARDRGARRFVVAGGETSGAVAQALGIDRLDIGPEITAGVPWCVATSGGHSVAITLKSGNFGVESFFADALERLA
jgi:uncharacterized protein YgbK (DUF1537 family)